MRRQNTYRKIAETVKTLEHEGKSVTAAEIAWRLNLTSREATKMLRITGMRIISKKQGVYGTVWGRV